MCYVGCKLNFGQRILNIVNTCSFKYDFFLCAVCGIFQFNSNYGGKQVIGVIGSSVNFTWAFKGASIKQIEWGTKNAKDNSIKDTLVTIVRGFIENKTAEDPLYIGRVSGVQYGSIPGKVVFSLNSIQMADERSYVCYLTPNVLGARIETDVVKLVVLGKQSST